MSLVASVKAGRGNFEIDVTLEAVAGETLVVVGPNGAGKTTLLRALAGLIPLTRGRVELDGRTLADTDEGVSLPTEMRPIGFVFQDLLLFPHLDVLDNVAFGLRSHGSSRAEARDAARNGLESIGLSGKEHLRPTDLSAGEAQKAALARALITKPRLLLLDEPFAALDVRARADARRLVRDRLGSFDGVRVLVTHDPMEAMALGDRLMVVEDGRVLQSGPPEAIRERPRSNYVADLVGVNLFYGDAAGGRVILAGGAHLVVPGSERGPVIALVHPRAVALYRDRPGGSPRNVWAGTIGALDDEGDRVRVRVDGDVPLVAEITSGAVAELGLAVGTKIWAAVKATEINVYPA